MAHKHTQGEWARNIKPASKYNTIYAGRNTHVAQLATSGLSEEEIEANCNLIVAAPELLEALEKLWIISRNNMPSELQWQEVYGLICKAKGETPL